MNQNLSMEERIALVRKTGRLDLVPGLESKMRQIRAEERAKEAARAACEAEALQELQRQAVEGKILYLESNAQHITDLGCELKDYLAKARKTIMENSNSTGNLELYKEHRQIMGRLNPCVNYLLDKASSYEAALKELEYGFEFTNVYLRQSLTYSYQYLNGAIRLEDLAFKLWLGVAPEARSRRYDRYISVLSSSSAELSWRLQQVLQNSLSN